MTAWRESKRGRRAFYGSADGAAAYRMRSHDIDDGEDCALGRHETTAPASAWRVEAARHVRLWLARTFEAVPLVVEHEGATLLRVEVQDRDEDRRWSVWVVDRADADIPVVIDDRVSVVFGSMTDDAIAWLNWHGIGCISVDGGRVSQVGDRRLHLKVYDPHREVAGIVESLGRDGGFRLMHLVAARISRHEAMVARRNAEWAMWNRSHLRRYHRKWSAENREYVRAKHRQWVAENAERVREKNRARKSLPEYKAKANERARMKRAEARLLAGKSPIDRKLNRAELDKARRARAAEKFKARYATDPDFRARIKANQQRSADRKKAAANAGVG